MNREDIIRMAWGIRMAREADADEHYVSEADDMPWSVEFSLTNLEAFAALVAAAEREACAKVCDDEATIEGVAQRCAQAIRARGQA